MKRHRNISLVIIICTILIPILSYASIGLSKPVGGSVIQTGKNPAIVCAAMSGPIFMRVFNLAIPGPFFIRAGLGGKPKIGGYLLANYSIVPDLGTCTNPETGVPIPAFELKPYGVSK